MRRLYLFTLIVSTGFTQCNNYLWAVVGAGPAGIIAATVLLENKVPPQGIFWIDPEFKVGRLGKYYGNVPSNLKAARYSVFLESCNLFKQLQYPSFDVIRNYDQQQEPILELIISPLQDITNYLRTQVTTVEATVVKLEEAQNSWKIITNAGNYYAEKVIAATGSHPKKMLMGGPQEISLDVAIDVNKLRTLVTTDDTVLVIGSAHSALLICKYLSEIPVKKVINAYTKEPTYGMYGGLEGITARWTKEIVETKRAINVERILFDEQSINTIAQTATKIIYAFGFERNHIPIYGTSNIEFDYKTGVINHNLFGIGIAFPEGYSTQDGNTVNLIGVNSFMKYAREHIPLWIMNS